MNEELKQELEALQVLNQFLDKLIPNMENLCRELGGEAKPDTPAFQNSVWMLLTGQLKYITGFPMFRSYVEKSLIRIWPIR